MFWRVFNKLFGWDYVAVNYGYSTFIRKVYKTKAGESYVMVAGEPVFLNKSRVYTPLTFIED